MNLKHLLLSLLLTTSLISNGQYADKTYAITGKPGNSFFWADIRQIDISTGKTVKTLFETNTTSYKTNDLDKKTLTEAERTSPAGKGIAACAYDKKYNRLYFAPMHFSDIKFLDLNKKAPTFTIVKTNVVTTDKNNYYQTENKHLTRMVIAADGYGYALTNDGNHLIRFTTGNKPVVDDLGELIDDESNQGISIHNKCSGWGGDMVADAFGGLIIVSANHNIFSVDVNTKLTRFLGNILDLPAKFTTNGAAVDDEGNLVLSSANVLEGLYKVSLKDLKAVKIATVANAFTASDLANANLLYQKEADQAKILGIPSNNLPNIYMVSDAHVFPNPVTHNEFTVFFNDQKQGEYNILFTDLSGKIILTQKVLVNQKSHLEKIHFTNMIAQGLYLVKVTDMNNQRIFIEKVIVK